MSYYMLATLPPMDWYILQEGNEGGELLGFNTVATKLLAVVTTPIHSALASLQDEVYTKFQLPPPFLVYPKVFTLAYFIWANSMELCQKSQKLLDPEVHI